MTLLELALAYASQGWSVFPCEPQGKQPLGLLVPHGLKDATLDSDQIKHWWEVEPHANIGLPTGLAFDVADLDTEEAIAHFLELARQHHTDLRPFPRALTGKGGRHLFVATTGLGNRAGVFPGLDWRGKGGYIVAPGSVHPSGTVYAWKQEPNGEFPDAPDWLMELLKPKPGVQRPRIAGDNEPPESYLRAAIDTEIADLRQAREGQRNDSLNRASFALGQLVGAGWISQHVAEAELTAAAYAIGLEKREITATIRSGLAGGIQEPRQPPTEGWARAAKLIIGERTRRVTEAQSEEGKPDGLRSVGSRDTTWYLNVPDFGELELTTRELRTWAYVETAHMERFNRMPKWNPRRPQAAWAELLRELMDQDPPREEGISPLGRTALIVQEIHRYCRTATEDRMIMLKRGSPVKSSEYGGYLFHANELVHWLGQLVKPNPTLQEIHNLVREHLGGRGKRVRLPDEKHPTRLVFIPLEAIEEEEEGDE